MKTPTLFLALLVFLALAFPAQAISCDQSQQLTQTLTDFLTLGGTEAVKPFLQGITYAESLVQFDTIPPLSFPALLCELNIEKQLQQYINAETGEPLAYLTIQNKNHNPTFINPRQGAVRPLSSKGEITYNLTLPKQDLKPSLKDFPILELFLQFTTPENTQLSKEEDTLHVHPPSQQPIQLGGTDRLTLMKPTGSPDAPLFTFGKNVAALPLQSRPGYLLHTIAFTEGGDWKYPENVPVDQQTYESIALISSAEQKMRKVPLQFMNGHGEAEDLLRPFEMYPDYSPFAEEKPIAPSILLNPQSLTVHHGRLELAKFEQNNALTLEGTFHLFLNPEGIHIALEQGQLTLNLSTLGTSLQLTQGSVYFYKDGSMMVFGFGKLHTTHADYTLEQGVTPNVFRITPEKKTLLLTGHTPFTPNANNPLTTYETSLESKFVQLLLPFDATIRLTEEGYELGKGTELQYQQETALPYGYIGVDVHGQAFVNYGHNRIRIIHTYNQDGFDNGYVDLRNIDAHTFVRYTDSEVDEAKTAEATSRVEVQLYASDEAPEEITEGNTLQFQNSLPQRARGVFLLETTSRTYQSKSSTLNAEWLQPTMPGAPIQFSFKNPQKEEDYFTLKNGPRKLIFTNSKKLRYRQETLTSHEPGSKLFVRTEGPDQKPEVIYFTQDGGLYTPQIDSLGSYDQEYFKNPNELYHPDYTGVEPDNLLDAIHGDLLWGYPTKNWLRVNENKILLDIGPLYHLQQYYLYQYDRELTLKELLRDILETLQNQSREASGFGSQETEQRHTQSGENLLHQIYKDLYSTDKTYEASINPEEIEGLTYLLSQLGYWYDYKTSGEKSTPTGFALLEKHKDYPDKGITAQTRASHLMIYSKLPHLQKANESTSQELQPLTTEQALTAAVQAQSANYYNRDLQQNVVDFTVKYLQEKQVPEGEIRKRKNQLLNHFAAQNAIQRLETEVALDDATNSYYEKAKEYYQEAIERHDAETGSFGFTSPVALGSAVYDTFLRESRAFDPVLIRNFDLARKSTLLCLKSGKKLREIEAVALQEKTFFQDANGLPINEYECIRPKEFDPNNPLHEGLSAWNIPASTYMYYAYQQDPLLLLLLDTERKTLKEGRIVPEKEEAAAFYQIVLQQGTSQPLHVEAALGASRLLEKLFGQSSEPAVQKILRKNKLMQENLASHPTITDPYYKTGLFRCAHGLLDVKYFLPGAAIARLRPVIQLMIAVPVLGYSAKSLISSKTSAQEKINIVCGIVGGVAMAKLLPAGAAAETAAAEIQVRPQNVNLLTQARYKLLQILGRIRPSQEKNPVRELAEDLGRVALDEKHLGTPPLEQPEPYLQELVEHTAQTVATLDLSQVIGKPLLKTNARSVVREFFQLTSAQGKELCLQTEDGLIYIVKNVDGKTRLLRLNEAQAGEKNLIAKVTPLSNDLEDSMQVFLAKHFEQLKTLELPTKTPSEVAEAVQALRLPSSRVVRELWEKPLFKDEPSFEGLQRIAQKDPAAKEAIDRNMDMLYERVLVLLENKEKNSGWLQDFIHRADEAARNMLVKPGRHTLDENAPPSLSMLKDLELHNLLNQLIHDLPPPTGSDNYFQTVIGDELPRLTIYIREALRESEPQSGILSSASRAIARIQDRVQLSRELEERTLQESLQPQRLFPTPSIPALSEAEESLASQAARQPSPDPPLRFGEETPSSYPPLQRPSTFTRQTLEEIKTAAQELAQGRLKTHPPLERFNLDTASQELYFKDLLKLVATRLFGASEKDLLTYRFSPEQMKIITPKFALQVIGAGEHQPTSEVFLLTIRGIEGPKKSLIIKVITAGSATQGSRDTPERVLIREVSNLVQADEALQGKPGIRIPKIIDALRVNHPRNPDSYMYSAEVAPGQSMSQWLQEDIGGKTSERLAQGITKLREHLSTVGKALGTFHTTKSPKLSGKVELENAAIYFRESIAILEKDSAFSADPDANLQTAQKIKAALADLYLRLLQRGDVSLVQIHKDFHLGNVFVDGNTATLIDLESRGFGVSGRDSGKFLYSLRAYLQATLRDYDPHIVNQVIQSEREAFLTAYKEAALRGDITIPPEEVDLLAQFYEAQQALLRLFYARQEGSTTSFQETLQTLKNILAIPDAEVARSATPEMDLVTAP